MLRNQAQPHECTSLWPNLNYKCGSNTESLLVNWWGGKIMLCQSPSDEIGEWPNTWVVTFMATMRCWSYQRTDPEKQCCRLMYIIWTTQRRWRHASSDSGNCLPQQTSLSGILGHLSICDDVSIGAHTLITKNIKNSGNYIGIMPAQNQKDWTKSSIFIKNRG